MEETVELRFKYTEQEYLSAYRKYFFSHKGSAFFIILTSSLMLSGIYFLVSGGDVAFTVSLIGTGSFLLGILATSTGILPRRRFRADPRFKSEYVLRFSEEGIEFHTDNIDSRLRWAIYKEALETEKFYLLSDGASTLTVIPKRVFTNSDQESVFRKMLDTRV